MTIEDVSYRIQEANIEMLYIDTSRIDGNVFFVLDADIFLWTYRDITPELEPDAPENLTYVLRMIRQPLIVDLLWPMDDLEADVLSNKIESHKIDFGNLNNCAIFRDKQLNLMLKYAKRMITQ